MFAAPLRVWTTAQAAQQITGPPAGCVPPATRNRICSRLHHRPIIPQPRESLPLTMRAIFQTPTRGTVKKRRARCALFLSRKMALMKSGGKSSLVRSFPLR